MRSRNIFTVYGWQLVSRILPQVLSFGVSVATVRFAGVDAVGMYAISVAVALLSSGLFAAALDTHLLRRQENASAGLVVAAKLLVWVCVTPIAAASLRVLDVPLIGGLAIYAALFFAQAAETTAVAARLENKDVGAVTPRVVPLATFLIAMIVIKPVSFENVAGLFLLSWAVVLFIPNVRRHVFTLASQREIRGLLWAARGIVGMLFFTQVYGNVDLILVKVFLNHTAAGEYRIAQSFAAVLMPSIAVLTFVYLSQLRPVIARKDAVRLQRMLLQQIILHVTVGLMVVLAMSVFLPWGISFFYGIGAKPAVAPALVLCGAAALNAVGMVLVYTLLGLEKDQSVLKATGVAAVASIAFSIFMVPIYGTSGAAWAMVLTFITMTAALSIMTRRALRIFAEPLQGNGRLVDKAI